MTSITIGSNVETIEQNAFYGCNKLTTITIPASVTAIGNNAFSNCNKLSSITFQRTSTSVSSYTYSKSFANANTPLTHIFVSNNSGVRDVYKSIFPESDMGVSSLYFEILCIGDDEPYSYDIVNNTTAKITSYNVTDVNKTRNDIVIPKILGGKPVRTIGANAFQDTLNVLNWGSIAQDNYKCIIIRANTVTTIEESAFEGCGSIRGLILESGLVTIGNKAFKHTSIAFINQSSSYLPNTVTSIGNRAFAGTAIQNITIPASVTTIQSGFAWDASVNGIFAGCSSLTEATLLRNISVNSHNYTQDTFANCSSLLTVKVPTVAISNYVSLFRYYSFTIQGT
ncbi:hypothetical protein FACS1894132_09210 [Clostridia bacterium]|nr:hypothetical protein FACS1894132_09210 [Clostridia bacterium]